MTVEKQPQKQSLSAEEITLCYIYEEVLLGKKTNYTIFDGKSELQKKNLALKLIRVIMTHYLCMSTEEFKHRLTKDMLQMLKITPLVKHLGLPFEFNSDHDTPIIGMMLESENGLVDEVEITTKVYEGVLDGTLSRYPKDFFSNTQGYYRALLCLKLAINRKKAFRNADEMFGFFYEHGKQFLKENKLYTVFKFHYIDEPVILMLFDAFPEDVQEEYRPAFEKYMAKEEERKRMRALRQARKKAKMAS